MVDKGGVSEGDVYGGTDGSNGPQETQVNGSRMILLGWYLSSLCWIVEGAFTENGSRLVDPTDRIAQTGVSAFWMLAMLTRSRGEGGSRMRDNVCAVCWIQKEEKRSRIPGDASSV